MNKKTLIGCTLLVSLFFSSLCLFTNKDNKSLNEVNADSERATLCFARGTPGIDQFYNYCPTIMQESDGTRHIYYCTNAVAGNVTDYIGYRVGIPDGDNYTYGNEFIVLSPTENTWDSRHTCDPSVIKGSFSYNSHSYSYLMAYLGCVTNDNSNNEIGLAVSDNPGGPWQKVDSLNPFKHFTGTDGYDGWEWGYGQPSLVSIDKSGKVLFTYTTGERSGTYVTAEKWNLSNLNSPSMISKVNKVSVNGLTKADGSVDNVLNNIDFAYDETTGRIYGVRDNHPNADRNPTVSPNAQIVYLEPNSSDLSVGGNLTSNCNWNVLKDLTPSVTGLNRNHNCGVVTDEYGHLVDSNSIETIITDGFENYADDWWTALATYRLYSYKTVINNTTNEYTFDVGVNISYTGQTNPDYLATWRLMPQDRDFSSGDSVAIRIKNYTGVDTPIRMAFNSTSDHRYAPVNNQGNTKQYYLLPLDGALASYPYREWDGDIWLKPNFDGWLVMKLSDQVQDPSYNNQGVFSWSSIFAIYFAIQTQYDYYAIYDIGDVYSVNCNGSAVTFIKPLMQCGKVSYQSTNSTFALDNLGEGRITIARKNVSFIPVVKFIDQLAVIDPCSSSSTSGYNAYPTLLSLYNSFKDNSVLLDYFENASLFDYQRKDTSHSQGLSETYTALYKWNYIIEQYNNNHGISSNSIYPIEDKNYLIVAIISLISLLSIMSVLTFKKNYKKN